MKNIKFVKLKSMDKKEMTPQQLNYFKAKGNECKEFKESSKGGFGKYVIFIVLGALVIGAIITFAIVGLDGYKVGH